LAGAGSSLRTPAHLGPHPVGGASSGHVPPFLPLGYRGWPHRTYTYRTPSPNRPSVRVTNRASQPFRQVNGA
jgi:hypothetical protein